MLLCKFLHKGNFIKEIFFGNFLPQNDELIPLAPKQVLAVTEKSLEVYDYFYDPVLKNHFFEPRFSQEIFLHILDCKVMDLATHDFNLIILLTTCGILVMQFSEGKFLPICSEVLNIHCEERDRLMYLKTDDKLGIICAFSNTNKIFVYKINQFNRHIELLNKISNITTFYIIDVIILSTISDDFSAIVTEELKQQKFFFELCAITRKVDTFEIEKIFFDENYKNLEENSEVSYNFSILNAIFTNINQLIILNHFESQNVIVQNLEIYSFLFSPFKNFFFLIGENGMVIIKTVPNGNGSFETVKVKKFKKNLPYVLASYTVFDQFLQIVFDNKIFVFEEDIYNKSIKQLKCGVVSGKLTGKKLKRVDEKEYVYVYYDNQMNLFFTKFEISLEGDMQTHESTQLKFELRVVNECINDSFLCLDSAMIKTNENNIYAVCGLRGNSRLVKYEKAFAETKFQEFQFKPVENIFIGQNNNGTLICLSTIDMTYFLKLNREMTLSPLRNLEELDVNIPERTVYLFQANDNEVVHIMETSIRVYELDEVNEIKKTIFKISFASKVVLGKSLSYKRGTKFYFILYFNTGMISIYSFDHESFNFVEESFTKLSSLTNSEICLSAFDCVVNEESESLDLVLGTFGSKVQVLRYDCLSKTLLSNFQSYNLESDGMSEVIPECIHIISKYVLISTRTGEFCIFMLNDNMTLSFLMPVQISEEKDTLVISDAALESSPDGSVCICVDLNNSTSAYNVSIRFGNSLTKVTKVKYLIKCPSSGGENRINFFKRFQLKCGLVMCLYQNYDMISISHFPPQLENSLAINELYRFEPNELARRLLTIDKRHVLALIENQDAQNPHLLLFDTTSPYQPSFKQTFDIQLQGVKINSMKLIDLLSSTSESDCWERSVMYICLCGQYEDTVQGLSKGFLLMYEINKQKLNEFKQVAKLPFPKPIYDICRISDIFIVAMENSLCMLKYEIENSCILKIKSDAKIQQYMNRIISLHAIPSSNYVIAGDMNESFQLVEFLPKASRFEVISADLALRSLYKALPINDEIENVILLQKNGVISKFELKDDLYRVAASIDIKEFMNRCHITKPAYFCTGILGSLICLKEISNEEILNESDVTLEKIFSFQCELFQKLTKFYFQKELTLEIAKYMLEPVKNVIMIDTLECLLKLYKNILLSEQDMLDYEKMIVLIFMLSEAVNF